MQPVIIKLVDFIVYLGYCPRFYIAKELDDNGGYTIRIFCVYGYIGLTNLILIMGYEVSLRPASLLIAFQKEDLRKGDLFLWWAFHTLILTI